LRAVAEWTDFKVAASKNFLAIVGGKFIVNGYQFLSSDVLIVDHNPNKLEEGAISLYQMKTPRALPYITLASDRQLIVWGGQGYKGSDSSGIS
jgi:hypothetical protein